MTNCAAGPILELHSGLPWTIDAMLPRLHPHHRFLRRAWYGQATDTAIRTALLRRRDGTPILALPVSRYGPGFLRLQSVPGSYWPFRAPLIAADATVAELTSAFAGKLADLIGPVIRIGPILAADPTTTLLTTAAEEGGWGVARRHVGKSFNLDLTLADGWPSKSRRKRLNGYERALAARGDVRYEVISGSAWSDDVLAMLADIEKRSWITDRTDGSGAKFIDCARRDAWRRIVGDSALAYALSATLLHVGDQPIAFSLDLRSGTTQYGIASSYDAAFADFRPGSLVTRRQFDDARTAGVTMVDLGMGDSGYKQDMGATVGGEMLDLLFCRSRSTATMLAPGWDRSITLGWAKPRLIGGIAAAGAILSLGD